MWASYKSRTTNLHPHRSAPASPVASAGNRDLLVLLDLIDKVFQKLFQIRKVTSIIIQFLLCVYSAVWNGSSRARDLSEMWNFKMRDLTEIQEVQQNYQFIPSKSMFESPKWSVLGTHFTICVFCPSFSWFFYSSRVFTLVFVRDLTGILWTRGVRDLTRSLLLALNRMLEPSDLPSRRPSPTNRWDW